MDFMKAFDKVPHGRLIEKWKTMTLEKNTQLGSGLFNRQKTEEEVDIVVSTSQRPQSNITNLFLNNIYMILKIIVIEATTLKLITIV